MVNMLPRFTLLRLIRSTLACLLAAGALLCMDALVNDALAEDALAKDSLAEKVPTDWQVGSSYWQQLDQPLGAEWSGSSLRAALAGLSRTQRICIWLDRQTNPDQELSFRADREPLRQALTRMAEGVGCGAGFMDSVAYIGPRDIAAQVATIAALRTEEVKQLAPAARQRWLERRAWHWEELAVPRDLLREIAEEGHFTVLNPDEVPHDLWPAVQLPPLTVAERLTLLLAGFRRTFAFDRNGSAIRLVPWPESATIARTYTASAEQLRGNTWSKQFPEMRIRRSGSSLEASGRYEEHVRLERWLRGEKAPAAGETRYSLKIENQPVGGVVQALARRLNYELEVDAQLPQDRLHKLISFRVENATPDELINRALQDTGIRAIREGNKLRLVQAP